MKCPAIVDNNTPRIMFLTNHVPVHWQFYSIGCCRLQNGCYLYYHAIDSVLTSGFYFIIPQVWNKIFIVLAILGICIMTEIQSAVKVSIFICISGRQIWDLGTSGSIVGTGWRRWLSGWRRL